MGMRRCLALKPTTRSNAGASVHAGNRPSGPLRTATNAQLLDGPIHAQKRGHYEYHNRNLAETTVCSRASCFAVSLLRLLAVFVRSVLYLAVVLCVIVLATFVSGGDESA